MPRRGSGTGWKWGFSRGSSSRAASSVISISSTETPSESNPSEYPTWETLEATSEPVMPTQPSVIEISSDSSHQFMGNMNQDEEMDEDHPNSEQESSYQGASIRNVESNHPYYIPYSDYNLQGPGSAYQEEIGMFEPPEAWPMLVINEEDTCEKLTDYEMDPVDPDEFAAYMMQEMATKQQEEEVQPGLTMRGVYEQGEPSRRRTMTENDEEVERLTAEAYNYPTPRFCRGPRIRHNARKKVKSPKEKIAKPAKVVRCYLCNEESFHSEQCPYSNGMAPMRCYGCGDREHYWTICPLNRDNPTSTATPHFTPANPSGRRSSSPARSSSSSSD